MSTSPGSSPGSPLTRAELDGVAAALAGAGEPVTGALWAETIAGGRSNLTVRLGDDEHRWVLRTPPRSGRTPSAHDVAREHRITTALHDTAVPVARPVLLCEDETLLGGPFTVAAHVDGAAVQRRTELDRLDDQTLTAAVDTLVTTLVALHGIEPEQVGLGRLGRPDAYAERQLARWSGQWELVGDASLRNLEAQARSGIAASLPQQVSTGIVHGDYRIDNTLLHLDGARTRVAAVVDWELCTLGDPVADVAMAAAYRHPAFDLVIGEPTAWTSPRLPSVEALATAYAAAGGVELTDWTAHLALAHYKVAVIAAGIAHRHRSGGDAALGTAHAAVGPYLEAALHHLG